MLQLLIGLVLAYPLVEMAEEWRKRKVSKRLLAKMRGHVAMQHKWDPVQGRWVS